MKIRVSVDGGGGSKSKTYCYGVRIINDDTKEVLHTSHGIIHLTGKMTSNIAEYHAMKTGLMLAWLNRDGLTHVILQGDSQIIMYQICGKYQCSKDRLIPHYNDCIKIIQRLKADKVSIEYDWVAREHNKVADRLGRQATDWFLHGSADKHLFAKPGF